MRVRSPREIWGMPTVLAIVSAIGLVSALLGDGFWDVLSWVALATPMLVMGWHLRRPAASRR